MFESRPWSGRDVAGAVADGLWDPRPRGGRPCLPRSPGPPAIHEIPERPERGELERLRHDADGLVRLRLRGSRRRDDARDEEQDDETDQDEDGDHIDQRVRPETPA